MTGGLIAVTSLLLVALAAVAFMDGGGSGGTGPQPSSGDEAGPAPATLITGTVTSARGPLADMRVRVRLWPAEDDTEVGEDVALVSLEPVRTDEQGRYVVLLPLKDVPVKYLMSRGIVNFDVWLSDAGVAPISTSARHPRAASWWVDVFDERHGNPKSLDFHLESMTATEKSGGERETWPLIEWR